MKALLTTLALVLPLLVVVPSSAQPQAAAAVQVLTWTANDSTTQYASAPTTAVAGETTIVFENSAATGNTTGMPHTLTFDTSTPGYNHDVNLNILANPFDSNNGRHEAQVTLTPGRYRYFCAIPGHSQMVGEFTVTAGDDTTPPTVAAEVSGNRDTNGNYIGSATVTITASDTQSGVDFIEYEVDDTGFQRYTAPVMVSAVGDHLVQYRATDVAGNVSPDGSVSFRVVEAEPVDTTPPTVTAVVTGDREPDGDYIGSALVTLSAEDAESGVDRIEYSLDSAPFVRYTEPVLVNQVGAHMVHYRATDRAGNTSAERMESFTVVAPPVEDTTPPTVAAVVTGNREPDGDYIGSATVTITAEDTESGVDRVEYSLDGAPFVRYTAPVVVEALGTHMVHYRATDAAGNTSPERMESFTVVAPDPGDTTPPDVSAEVSGNREPDGDYIGTATVTVTASDNESGVDSVEYSVDGAPFVRYTEPVTVDAAGSHTVQYRATDVAGNVSDVGTVSFTIVESGPDACPDSDTRSTVIIDGYSTGVANVDTGNGCTINDLIDEDGVYADHASFVRHVDSVTDKLVTDGILTLRDKGSIVRAAARSDIGN